MSRLMLFVAAGFAAASLGLAACGSFSSDPASSSEDGGTETSTPPPPPDGSGGDADIDGAAPVDAGVDAATCDLGKPFNAPQLVPGTVVNNGSETYAWLTPDEKDIFFTTSRESVATTRIYTGHRDDRTQQFNTAAPVALTAHARYEERPTFGPDLKYMAYSRTDGGSRDLFVAYLDGGSYVPAQLDSASSALDDIEPYGVPTRGSLLFASNRGPASYTVYTATFTGGAASNITTTTLMGFGQAFAPVMTPDGLTLYFASDRDVPAQKAKIYVATRTSIQDPFGTPVALDAVNNASPTDERPNWISPDNCRLYFHSYRSGSPYLYVAERP